MSWSMARHSILHKDMSTDVRRMKEKNLSVSLVCLIFLALTIERRSEDYTYLRYSDGVRCKWDNGMTVYVTVEQTYMKQLTGLCGTYTNRPDGKDEILLLMIFSCEENFSR